ncbi:hypothetical protein LOK49_LG01G00661 [Camellia lanceoleosa]|uniref:Uncharacterized protein n=1 Tax=Camellia lanceoleosa TaxID=1840588 RepID=A0ACC0IZH1_9ERIC|nr:hypothetical protein LOK49_LG01G00661 [Camellia lanceoleosa]
MGLFKDALPDFMSLPDYSQNFNMAFASRLGDISEYAEFDSVGDLVREKEMGKEQSFCYYNGRFYKQCVFEEMAEINNKAHAIINEPKRNKALFFLHHHQLLMESLLYYTRASDISTQLVVKVAWLCCIIHDILVSTIRADFENMLENEVETLAGITLIM